MHIQSYLIRIDEGHVLGVKLNFTPCVRTKGVKFGLTRQSIWKDYFSLLSYVRMNYIYHVKNRIEANKLIQ